MNIALTGSAIKKEELKSKISSKCNISEFEFGSEFPKADLLIDLDFDNHPQRIMAYADLDIPILLSAVKIQLMAVLGHFGVSRKKVFGINAIPTFINRDLSEVSSAYDSDRSIFEELASTLDLKLEWVEDRVGMVSPRVLFMIINEAYYTLQEGTAGKSDINTGMKLGTAYPHGPFEWVDMIGIEEIFQTLDAMYLDTRDERYKICPLLKTEAMRAQV